MTSHIRPGAPDDLDAAMAVIAAAIAHMEAQGIRQWDAQYPNRAVLADDIARGTLHVACRDGQVRGLIVLDERWPDAYAAVPWTVDANRALIVHRLAVHPDCQGQGIARALMDFAEGAARAAGYGAIRLDAFAENPRAIALYTHRGYHCAGTVTFRKGMFHCFELAIQP